jgi:aspartate/methionine/tyrosine aminotransferase
MLKNCNCKGYCFACVSQHSAFVDLVWSITEKAMDLIYDETQKKVSLEIVQDDTDAPQRMENAINEAVANTLFYSMTTQEIKELIK